MARTARSAALFWCATMLVLAPAGVVCAQEPAGTGGSEPIDIGPTESGQPQDEAEAEEEQTSTPDGDEEEPIPPKPAGVPAAEAPKVADEEQVEQDPVDRVMSGGAVAAGSGRMGSFPGVFRGAAPAGREAGHTLDLSASLYGVRLEGETPVFEDPNDLRAGTTTYGGGSVGLSYAHNWTEASVDAYGIRTLAYSPEYEDRGGDPWINRWSAGAGAAISRAVGKRTRVSGNGQVYYSPFYQQDLLSQFGAPTIGQPVIDTPGLDLAVAREPTVHSTFSGDISYNTTERASLTGYYSLVRRDLVSGDSFGYYSQMFGGRYTYRLNQYLGVRAGYGYRIADFAGPDTEPIASHDLDVGADGGYGRSFSLSRRTTFSFQTGSSVFLHERSVDSTDNRSGTETRLFVNGSASLVHTWGRTWSANVGGSRSVNYEIGFSEPFLSNAVFAAVGGLLTPRLDFTASASRTAGSVGFGSGNNGFGASYATAALRMGLTEWLATYVQYFYYRHDFESGVALPVFVSVARDRQGVSVGLTTSFRLIGSRGRP